MSFFPVVLDTPSVKRKASMNESDIEEKEAREAGDKVSLPGELSKAYGGSQGSINSASSSSLAPDNPEQFENLKQMKELMEQGIEK